MEAYSIILRHGYPAAHEHVDRWVKAVAQGNATVCLKGCHSMSQTWQRHSLAGS